MANEIVWYDSTETGAPTLNNAAGSLDAVMYACLVTGFRTITLDSVTVTANVATATFSGGHGYSDQRMVDLSGAGTALINGRKLITVTGASTFTFPAPGVSNGTISGSIEAKRSPLGWIRPLSSGFVSMYQRTDVTATAMCLRVDDSGTGVASATAARWRMVESFTDLSTFVNPTPGAGAFGGGGAYIPKGPNTAAAKQWLLVGDGRTFYMFTESSSYPASSYSDTPQGIFAFGDVEPFRSGDAYACLLAGADDATYTTAQSLGYTPSLSTSTSYDQVQLARPYHAIGSSVRASLAGPRAGSRLGSSSANAPPFPSPVDNGIVLSSPVLLLESNAVFNNPLRGRARGLGDPLASIPAGMLHRQVLDGLIGSDRRWLMVGFNQQGSYGHAAFDITGPW